MATHSSTLAWKIPWIRPFPDWEGQGDIQEENQIQSKPEGQSGGGEHRHTERHKNRHTDLASAGRAHSLTWGHCAQVVREGRLPREDLTGEARDEAAISAFTFYTFVGRELRPEDPR